MASIVVIYSFVRDMLAFGYIIYYLLLLLISFVICRHYEYIETWASYTCFLNVYTIVIIDLCLFS